MKGLPKIFAFNATPIKLGPKLEFVDYLGSIKKKEFRIVKHVQMTILKGDVLEIPQAQSTFFSTIK